MRGGGDNVKHGDLSSVLFAPDRNVDVHMAKNGLNFACSACHVSNQHVVAGSRYNVAAHDTVGTGKPGAMWRPANPAMALRPTRRCRCPGPETDTALWTNFDWAKTIKAGMDYVGQPYSGEFDFADTHMYWPITHMVAPKEVALVFVLLFTGAGLHGLVAFEAAVNLHVIAALALIVLWVFAIF